MTPRGTLFLPKSAPRENQFDENRNLTSQNIRLDPEFGNSKTIQYATNFTKNFKTSGYKLSFDFQYEESDEDLLSLILSDGLNTDILGTIEDQNSILLQSDYVLPIGDNSQFELGYRGNFSELNTDYTLLEFNDDRSVDDDGSNNLIYREYVNGVYSQFGSKIKDKF